MGVLTTRGGAMARMPLHPRFALMLLEASERGVLETVALIAALSQGRAIYRAGATGASRARQLEVIEDACGVDSDWLVQVRAWEVAHAAKFNKGICVELGIHAAAARQAGTAAKQLQGLLPSSQLKQKEAASSIEVPTTREAVATAVGQCLLAGFSDYIALRNTRGTRRCRLMHGKSGELRRESVVESELFVATEQEERQVRGEVTLLLGMATRVEPSWLKAQFPNDFSDVEETRYDSATRRVVCARERRFRDLVLATGEAGEPDAGEAASLLAAEVVAGRLLLKHWNQAVETWITRVNFVAKHCPETEILPIDAEGRQLLIEQICEGALSYKAIKDREVLPLVKEWISPEQKYYLETYAPKTIDLPRRKRPAVLRYELDGRVFIASKLQDFYDVPGTRLTIAQGQVPLVVELLAPSGRPAHVTDDLDGFWDGAYAHVRKELAGRYPKHEWR